VSETFEVKPTIPLKATRCCECGRWSAREDCIPWECPTCLQRKINALIARTVAQDRTIAALRGALTRRRRRG
jgi:hypothetical protein